MGERQQPLLDLIMSNISNDYCTPSVNMVITYSRNVWKDEPNWIANIIILFNYSFHCF